uniref:Uncharacterized protein n=1 Tax=Amphimedon queenslandica TaxID=400682 RepID=A0A1X7UJV4_AMPQE
MTLLFLRYSSILRLISLLHSYLTFLSASLKTYDNVLCSLLSLIANQAGWFGGTVSRAAAPSCYLSSAAASAPHVHLILSSTDIPPSLPYRAEALVCWSKPIPFLTSPADDKECSQYAWDRPQVDATFDNLLESVSNDVDSPRLITVLADESGAWRQCVPISSLGLCLDDMSVRICVALRLGLPLCAAHTCRHCGATIDSLGLHWLSCKKGRMRFHRHAAINDVLHRALSSTGIPSCLERSGLFRSHGKRPDRLTLVPWEPGKPLFWDATVPDTLAYKLQSKVWLLTL